MSLRPEIRKLVDPSTGKEEGEIPVLAHQNAALRDNWMFNHEKGYLRLAKEGLNGQDFEVLMVYFAKLDFNNYIQVSQQEIADYLEIPKQNVNRSTKKLVEKKILLEGPKVGRSKTYILSTFYGWKGRIGIKYYKTYDEHSNMLEQEEPPITLEELNKIPLPKPPTEESTTPISLKKLPY